MILRQTEQDDFPSLNARSILSLVAQEKIKKSRRHKHQIKLSKEFCEVCGDTRVAALNIHHIIPRCDPRCSNDNHNLSIVCHTCHDLIHAGEITIIGVYDSTDGRKLLFFKEGEEPPLEKQYWKIKDNPHVLRRSARRPTTSVESNISTERT
jgi:hypothetical protein